MQHPQMQKKSIPIFRHAPCSSSPPPSSPYVLLPKKEKIEKISWQKLKILIMSRSLGPEYQPYRPVPHR
jgi:hypothetical protein